MSEWIKCSDRLPELNETVDIWISGESAGRMTDMGRVFVDDADGWLWVAMEGIDEGDALEEFGHEMDDVTHWQPLPAPPTEAA